MVEALEDKVLRLVDNNTSRDGMLAFLNEAMSENTASVPRIRRLIFFVRHGIPVSVADSLDNKLYEMLSDLN